MQLFHGSNTAVTEPRLIEQSRGLDFGAGFYLTTDERQAMRFSEVVTARRGSGSPTVSVYEFDMGTAVKNLSIRKFARADEEWLRFVTENRLITYRGEFYDAVIGAVANDTVMPTIQAYLSGLIGAEATLITLKTSRLTDQVCLKSERALSMLRFVKFFDTGGSARG